MEPGVQLDALGDTQRMTNTRLYADKAGESHFEDVVVALDATGLCEAIEVTRRCTVGVLIGITARARRR